MLYVLGRVAKKRFTSRTLTSVADKKLRPNQTDEVIGLQIPNPETGQKLYDNVTKNMIHGPCDTLNMSLPCIKEEKCTKKYQRVLLKDTQTKDKGSPLYKQR